MLEWLRQKRSSAPPSAEHALSDEAAVLKEEDDVIDGNEDLNNNSLSDEEFELFFRVFTNLKLKSQTQTQSTTRININRILETNLGYHKYWASAVSPWWSSSGSMTSIGRQEVKDKFLALEDNPKIISAVKEIYTTYSEKKRRLAVSEEYKEALFRLAKYYFWLLGSTYFRERTSDHRVFAEWLRNRHVKDYLSKYASIMLNKAAVHVQQTPVPVEELENFFESEWYTWNTVYFKFAIQTYKEIESNELKRKMSLIRDSMVDSN